MTEHRTPDDLERWAAELRAQDAAQARARERWLRTQAEEEADLAGALLAMAERGTELTVHTREGRSYSGALRAVGRDFAALVTPAAPLTLVPLGAIALMTAKGGDSAVQVPPAASGDGSDGSEGGAHQALDATLAGVLGQAAGNRPAVSIDTAAQVVVGNLRSVGTDILTVRTGAPGGGAGERGRLAVVPLQSVSAISLLDSG